MRNDPVEAHFSSLAEHGVWESLYQPGSKVTAENSSFLVRARRVMELLVSTGRRPQTLLDVGCGTAPLGPAIVAMGAQYTGIDFSAKMIEAARNLMRDQIATGVARLNVGDATKLDLPDAAFDSIIAMGLVEYFSRSKVDRVFEEMVRVLAPGGVLIVTIPKRWHWGKVIELLLTPLRKWIRWRPYSSDLKLRRKEAEAFERLYMTPMDVDRTAQKVGLHKLAQRHYNVQLVCPPFTLLGPRLAYLINRPFEWLALIPGGWFFASGYIGMYTR